MEFQKFVKPLDSALDTWRAGQAKKKEESAKRKKDKQDKQESSKKEASLFSYFRRACLNSRFFKHS